jgi:hypothetical protein
VQRRIRNITAGLVISILAASCGTTIAAGMSPDPTGLWFDPAESGWGLSLVQRDDTIFALLLVYDEQQRPTWYAASNVTADGPAGLDPGAMAYTGVLYRTSGPWFGGAFDPQNMGSSAVGNISVQYVPGAAGAALDLAYTANGVSAAKVLVPQVQPRALSMAPPDRSEAH